MSSALQAAAVVETSKTLERHRCDRRRRRDEPCAALPSNAGPQLMDAIVGRDMQRAQGLLMARADANDLRDSQGRTALQLAAMQGVAGLCRMLVSHRADLDAIEKETDCTALHLAVMSGRNAMVRLLLEAGSSTNICSASGETPLTLAVGDGNLEAIQLLLEANAQVDLEEIAAQPGRVICSALLRAVEREAQCELIERLVRARADLSAKDEEQNQPLHIAISRGDVRVARFLLDSHADPECRNKALRTPLHCAAGRGCSRILRALVERRADLDSEDCQGTTPLQIAANSTIQRHLRELGAREKLKDRSASGLLPGAAWAGGPVSGGVFPAGRLTFASGMTRKSTTPSFIVPRTRPMSLPLRTPMSHSPATSTPCDSPASPWRIRLAASRSKVALPQFAWLDER
eukprot:TRINITY_DN21930_c0_g2_i1.p1 TRINITY_DN21930_c0_g2~~TRINITY_DN21930_c0_g2_i1.p1  ORF type:complete len:404 (+),score=56.85 TRINITY_DN21930_c0_g2_i1:107-1318(+)